MPVAGPVERTVDCVVACLGDIMLDVIVDSPTGLVPDDDTPARISLTAGGQAANVAAWVTALGGRATLFGPRSRSDAGHLVEHALARHRVDLHGPFTDHVGTVLSLLTGDSRALASDAGTSDWLREVTSGAWIDGADWLFVSGYSLLRSPDPERILGLAEEARATGTRVAVDLASASMIEAYGATEFHRLWRALRPAVVFAGDAEWQATHDATHGADSPAGSPADSFGAGGTSVLVLKHGADGSTFVIDGIGDHRVPCAGPVRDVTGAGDALAAGYLVGGTDLAMQAAARCVAQVGAQPPPPDGMHDGVLDGVLS